MGLPENPLLLTGESDPGPSNGFLCHLVPLCGVKDGTERCRSVLTNLERPPLSLSPWPCLSMSSPSLTLNFPRQSRPSSSLPAVLLSSSALPHLSSTPGPSVLPSSLSSSSDQVKSNFRFHSNTASYDPNYYFSCQCPSNNSFVFPYTWFSCSTLSSWREQGPYVSRPGSMDMPL